MLSKRPFLLKSQNSFHLSEKKLDDLHLNECRASSKQPLTLYEHKIIVAYLASHHRLAIEIGKWLTISNPSS